MADTKVKLRDIQTNQEYLLLIVKMNLKGILVRSTQTIAPNTPLELSLQLNDNKPPLSLRGVVHKIAKNSGGGRGVIIRFVKITSKEASRLATYIETHARELGPESPRRQETPSREKTSVAGIASLSKLALSSPDQKPGFVTATVDEEAVHEARPGLSGETRVYDVSPSKSHGRSRAFKSPLRSALKLSAIFAVLLLVTLFLFRPIVRFLDQRFGERPTPIQSKADPTPSPLPTVRPTRIPTSIPAIKVKKKSTARKKKRKRRKKKTALSGRLTSYKIKDSKDFVKISIQGTGNFSQYKTSRAQSPKRLILDLPKIRTFSVKKTQMVGKSPVLRIRTQRWKKRVRVVFDLYPVSFPRYQIKKQKNSIDLYFQR